VTPLPRLVAEEAWMADGACRTTHADLWFPGRGQTVTEAKPICNQCPVTDECLEYAIANNERFGIWGGTSERERERLRATRPIERRVAVRPTVDRTGPRLGALSTAILADLRTNGPAVDDTGEAVAVLRRRANLPATVTKVSGTLSNLERGGHLHRTLNVSRHCVRIDVAS
jgi:WhiB family transcriptional regulator, redox-sensing transcriptional regulator